MKIASLQIRCVSVTMPVPHRTASGVIAASPLVLLTVDTDAGVRGHSITFTYTPAALKPTADLMKNIEPLVAGQTLAPAALAELLQAKFRLLGTQGLVGMALADIDMALWDALARSRQLPLHTLLGAAPKPLLDFRHAFNAGVREHVMPDVMKCGGVTGWLSVSAMAQVHGAGVSSHLWPELSAQLLTATPTARWLEYADWWNPVLKQPLKLREGLADIEGVLGSGIEFDEAAVSRCLA